MAGTVFGNDAVLQVNTGSGYVNIGCAYSCSFEFSNELIGKTDVNAGLFRKKRVRISDSKMSVQGLTNLVDDTVYSPFYFLQEGVRRTEQDLRILFTDENGIQKQVQGFYLVESIQLSGKSDDFSEYDIEFQGTGTISLEDPDGDTGDIPGNIQFDWWPLAEGATTISGPGNFGRSFTGEPIKLVDREGIQMDEVTVLSDGRQYTTDGTTLTFLNAGNPGGERVYVMWQTV